MRDSESVSKKIFALQEDRFRLKAVKRIESPGWKAGLYRSSQYIKKVRLKVEPPKEKNWYWLAD